jgi:hypothetical protein
VTESVGETGAASNPLGIATALPPVPSWVNTKFSVCPLVQVASVLLVMLAVSAVLRRKVVTDPVVAEGQVNVGVAEKVVVTTEAAEPTPPLTVAAV